MWRGIVVLLLATGCRRILGFEEPVVDPGDGGVGGDSNHDGSSDGGLSFIPLHLTEATGAPGTGALALTSTTIDTGLLGLGQPLPAGVSFDVVPQQNGPELAVLRVSTLSVAQTGVVRVTGIRPLVVVASGAITIDGVLDAAARGASPGAGGHTPDAGAGKGGFGAHAGSFNDSGGGGGGFGRVGGPGGGVMCGTCGIVNGGIGGIAYGDDRLTILQGGSGGGSPVANSCGVILLPGAGGGAIQLSSAASISIGAQGSVLAGGGGGAGGVYVMFSCNWSAGAGGGSGGAIILQSPDVRLAGLLAANGGGGGSGASGGDGNQGEDGNPSSLPAMGGTAVGAQGGAGGPGGSRVISSSPGVGTTTNDSNGGGGGGGVGRVMVVSDVFVNTGLASPDAVLNP